MHAPRTFKPIYALWAEKGLLKGGLPKRYQGVAAGRRSAANKLPTVVAPPGGRCPAPLRAAGSRGADEDDVDALAEGLLRGQGATELPERGARGPLSAARRALSLANAPTELPCRDAEKAKVSEFIEGIVVKGEPRRPRIVSHRIASPPAVEPLSPLFHALPGDAL